MGMYNRWTKQNQPEGWSAAHADQVQYPNLDSRRWHIAVHPFTDMLYLYVEGELGAGQTAIDRMQELFDLSQVEIDQLLEVWQNFINVPAGDTVAQRRNVLRLQGILRAMERGIPQRYRGDDAAVRTWLYNKLGIAIADER